MHLETELKPHPLALICELTYKCPLKCVYCSNPISLKSQDGGELLFSEWIRIFREAKELGVKHVHLTGGEPLVRTDLQLLVQYAHSVGLYTNLITSGIGLNQTKLKALVQGGLDHIQLSFQDSNELGGQLISGVKSHSVKMTVAKMIRAENIAFTLNLVVHRHNLSRLAEMIEMAYHLGAHKLEVAHVQYYGWAFENRVNLTPTPEEVDQSLVIIRKYQKKFMGLMRIDAVTPNYSEKYPKACMGGWAQKIILINPYGLALPCHSALILPNIVAPDVRQGDLNWIWNQSSLFQKFRGEDWMSDPCRFCERRKIDFGGCRCQSFILTQDPARTDPVCNLSSDNYKIRELLSSESRGDRKFVYRRVPKMG
ncbi:MAG: pyrroloquinoline quinone biosynthesis protein PqqE [Bdellovibrionia bacterium]